MPERGCVIEEKDGVQYGVLFPPFGEERQYFLKIGGIVFKSTNQEKVWDAYVAVLHVLEK